MADTQFVGQLDPDLNTQLLNAQQQAQRAQAMYGMGMAPIEPVGPRSPISPLAVIGKLLMAYKGPQAMQEANANLGQVESKIAQNRLGLMASILRGQDPNAASGSPTPTGLPANAAPQGNGASPASTPAPNANTSSGVPDVMQDPVWQKTAFGEQLGMLPQGSADNYAKARYTASAPTDLQKLVSARQSAPEGSPLAQALDDAIAKQNYLAPVEVKPGNVALNPRTNQPMLYNPAMEKGMTPDFSNPLNPSASATPGYLPAAQNLERMKAGSAIRDVMVNGVAQPMYAGDAVAGAGGNQPASAMPSTSTWSAGVLSPNQLGMLQQGAQAGNPQARDMLSSYQQWASGRPPGAQGVQVGQSPADQQAEVQAAKDNLSLGSSAPQSRQAMTGLENALQVMKSLKATGPGTAPTNEFMAKMANVVPGLKPGDNANNYQLVSKYLNNSLAAASSVTGASGSDARFEQFSHGQPNADTLNISPLQQATRYTLSQYDAIPVKNAFIANAVQQAKAAGNPQPNVWAQQEWAKVYNPRVFEFNRMEPAERAQFKASMTPQQQQNFRAQYNAAHQQGWVQ